MVLETLHQTQYVILLLLSCHFGRAATFGGPLRLEFYGIECYKFCRPKCLYFTSIWNWLETFQDNNNNTSTARLDQAQAKPPSKPYNNSCLRLKTLMI